MQYSKIVIGKFSIGKRASSAHKFFFFYCPLLKENKERFFHFFFWIGKKWYVAWHK